VVGGFAAVLLTVTAVMAVAAWPWSDGRAGGPAGGGGSAGASAARLDGAAVVWRVNTGVPAVEPPAVSGQWILVSGRDGTLRAYRRADGVLAWEMELGDGARADAAVTNGVAYAVTGNGRIVAVDATYGTEIWHRDIGHPVSARPAVDGEHVYAGDGDGVLSAYAIGAGHRRWRAWSEGGIVGSPVVGAGIVVVASGDGKLNGISSAGAVRWRAQAGEVTDGPVVAGDAACAAIRNGTVRCVTLKDGAELDGIADEVSISRIAGGDGVLYACGEDGSVTAWDVRTSHVRWRYRAGQGGVAGIPVVRAGEIDVAYPDGRILGLDAHTGGLRWQNATGDRFDVAASGDAAGLFGIGASGTLYALRPPGTGPGAQQSTTAFPITEPGGGGSTTKPAKRTGTSATPSSIPATTARSHSPSYVPSTSPTTKETSPTTKETSPTTKKTTTGAAPDRAPAPPRKVPSAPAS
jgi:outer membrane protein assembly factor BamB